MNVGALFADTDCGLHLQVLLQCHEDIFCSITLGEESVQQGPASREHDSGQERAKNWSQWIACCSGLSERPAYQVMQPPQTLLDGKSTVMAVKTATSSLRARREQVQYAAPLLRQVALCANLLFVDITESAGARSALAQGVTLAFTSMARKKIFVDGHCIPGLSYCLQCMTQQHSPRDTQAEDNISCLLGWHKALHTMFCSQSTNHLNQR